MTYEDATEFFFWHGNCGSSLERLRMTRPTTDQLVSAGAFAIRVSGQSARTCVDAVLAICDHWGVAPPPGFERHRDPTTFPIAGESATPVDRALLRDIRRKRRLEGRDGR